MTPAAILAQLRRDGLRVRTDGERVLLAPRELVTADVLDLVREHKPALIETLARQAAPRLVTCAACRHFSPLAGDSPDGYCRRYRTEAWAGVPFACAGYRAADDALEHRRQQVLEDLASHPERRYSVQIEAASLKRASEPVSVMVAVRTPGGIVSAEYRIPADRWDMGEWMAMLDATSEHPA